MPWKSRGEVVRANAVEGSIDRVRNGASYHDIADFAFKADWHVITAEVFGQGSSGWKIFGTFDGRKGRHFQKTVMGELKSDVVIEKYQRGYTGHKPCADGTPFIYVALGVTTDLKNR